MMKILKEYSQSGDISIQATDDPLFNRLLKKELKLRSVSSTSITFSSNGYCGLLTVGGSPHFIVPQFGPEMLTILLPIAFGIKQQTFQNSSGLGPTGLTYADGIASIFLSAYESIARTGIRSDYSSKLQSGLLSTGSLNLQKSLIFLNFGLGSPVWKKPIFDINTYLNQSIKFVFHILSTSFPLSSGIKLSVNKILSEMTSVAVAAVPDYLRLISSLNRTTEHYKVFLEFASAFQLGMGQSSGVSNSVCCLFESWRIFQQAIKNELSKAATNRGLSINVKSSLSLQYTEGSKRLDPDIIIYSNTPSISAMGDIKYSENEILDLDRSNMFQVNAYMDGYNLLSSFLVYPTGKEFSFKRYVLRWGKSISVYRIPVLSTDGFIDSLGLLLDLELTKSAHKDAPDSAS